MPDLSRSPRTAHIRHVVITGASSGLGAALAEVYAARGAGLTLLGRDRDRLGAVAKRCSHNGAGVETICCDVRDVDAMCVALGDLDDRNPVTLLIANAGIGGRAALAGPAAELPEAARHLIATNVTGLINTVTPLLPRFVERRAGQVAIISSIAAFSGMPQAPAYSASKAAARVYGEGLRRLLGRSGVAVTVVCPGFIDTPMSASLPTARPFLVPVDQAALRIANAIAQQRAELTFPWQLAVAARFDRWLPATLGDRLVSAAAAWSTR